MRSDEWQRSANERAAQKEAARAAWAEYLSARFRAECDGVLRLPETQSQLNELYSRWRQAALRESMSYRAEWSEAPR